MLLASFSAMPPVSIKTQQLSGLNSVKITWKPNVAATGITGYKVYRDGNKVSSDVVTAEGFVDAGVPVGEHKYEVTAVYGDVESADSETATVKVENQKLSTPTNLFAQQHGYSAAYMEWNNPSTNFGALTYFNPDNANLETFGLSLDGESYETAIVFDAVTLSAYKGQKLTSVGFTRWRLRAAGLSTSTHAAQTVSCRSSTHSRYAEAELRRAQRR